MQYKKYFLSIIFCLFNHLIWAIDNSSDNDWLSGLYVQAESAVAAKPSESNIAVESVYKKYRKLQIEVFGRENANFNQKQVEKNPVFAKTNIFETKSEFIESQAKIKFIRLHYTTNNSSGRQNVSGLLLLPPGTPKGIFLFFHSTASGKLNVPSLSFVGSMAQMLAAVFAANGYIVAAPDYIGLGDNFKVAHPYIIYPQMNVDDGKNMLLAAIRYLEQKQIYKGRIKLPLYVSGYSEGASYALWFSRIYQDNPKFAKELNRAGLKLIKTVAADGAYNLTGVMLPFLLTSQVNDTQNKFGINTAFWGTLLKPMLLANLMIGYSYYNQQPLATLLNRDFLKLQCNLLLQNSCGQNKLNQYDLETFLLTPSKNFSLIFKYFLAASFKTGQGIIYSPFFNSIYPLLGDGAAADRAGLSHYNLLI